jgi:hypothetical protein
MRRPENPCKLGGVLEIGWHGSGKALVDVVEAKLHVQGEQEV